MAGLRLGDEVDDYCVKCKRLTTHFILALMEQEIAKVRCRSCYGEHEFRNGNIPPSKRELKKQALFNEVLNKTKPGDDEKQK
jgi:hypothetical protein